MKDKVSVIISTYNGAAKIGALLNSLSHQTVQPDEVIVVIDGSTDNTVECIKPFERTFQSFNVVIQENKGRAAVRNRGATEASGNIFVFYDDDMRPGKDSTQQHLDFHSKNKGMLSGNQVELMDNAKTDIQNYKAYLSEKWTKKFGEKVTRLTMDNLFFTAANCSMSREIFQQLNGFDERLTDAEDYDLACRAIEKNVSVFFDKRNKAIHCDPITCKSYVNRLRTYKKAHEVLKKLHPHRYPIISDEHDYSVFKKIIYRLGAFSLWVRIIDHERVIRFLPTRIRYKLYDVVIQALAIEYPHISL